MLPTKANESPPGVVNSASLGEQNAQSQGYPCSRFEEPGGFFIHLSMFFPSDWCVLKKSGLDLAELCPQTHLKCLIIFGGYSPETNAANHHLNRDVLVKSWCRSSVVKVRFYMIRLAPDTLQGFPVAMFPFSPGGIGLDHLLEILDGQDFLHFSSWKARRCQVCHVDMALNMWCVAI